VRISLGLCLRQTEGADLPEFEHNISGEVGEHRDRMIAFLAQQNIKLEFNEKIAPALGVSYGGKIALLPGQSTAEEFSSRLQAARYRARR
jgi:hypothetical protein